MCSFPTTSCHSSFHIYRKSSIKLPLYKAPISNKPLPSETKFEIRPSLFILRPPFMPNSRIYQIFASIWLLNNKCGGFGFFIHSFIFIYLGTVAPSVHENCFSGGRGTNVTTLRFDSSLKGGKRWCLFNIKFKAIPKLRSTKRYSPLPIVSFS